MPVIDVQVHPFDRDHPGRPWAGPSHGLLSATGEEMVAAVSEACRRGGGDGVIPEQAAAGIRAASQVLNIAWIAEALDSPASVICPRSGACPRQPQGCV